MNILEALDDPSLFGPHFRGPSWAAWRAFLTAACLPCQRICRPKLLKPPRGAPASPTAPIHGSGIDRRPSRRQKPHSSADRRLFGLLPGLCALPRAGRGCDDCGACCESPPGPEHFSVHIGHFESRSAVRADGRGRKHRGDHAGQSCGYRDRHRVFPHDARVQLRGGVV